MGLDGTAHSRESWLHILIHYTRDALEGQSPPAGGQGHLNLGRVVGAMHSASSPPDPPGRTAECFAHTAAPKQKYAGKTTLLTITTECDIV